MDLGRTNQKGVGNDRKRRDLAGHHEIGEGRPPQRIPAVQPKRREWVKVPQTRPETGGLGAPLRVEADLSTQARVKAACELTAQPKLGNGRGALERWPRKQALTICRGAGTEQRGEVGLSHVIERVADRNVCERHPPRHQEVTTLQPLLE